MASYKAPGVYVQDITSGSQNIEQASSSVGILIGFTRSGLINVAQKITSWTEYVSKYANGLDTPFIEDDYLSYAVYGFFKMVVQNCILVVLRLPQQRKLQRPVQQIN